jgi:uncharacterized membrane protein
MVSLLQLILTLLGLKVKERELFMAAVTYSFIFSLVLTNGFALLISRYLSDQIFDEAYDEILPSLYGLITICLIIGSICGGIFYAFSPLYFAFKCSAYLLFMELIVIWLLSVYISTFKDYMRIVKGFLLGLVVTIIFAVIFINFLPIESVLSCLVAMNIGMAVIIVDLLWYMRGFLASSQKNYFKFLSYFDKYPALFLIGLFYMIGIYVHNFVFWAGKYRVVLKNTYVYCPFYDVPSFYAMLTIVLGMVIFVVSIETAFYEKYKRYYTAVLGEGTLEDINRIKGEMYRVLVQELAAAMTLQLIFTLFFMLAGIYLLPRIGFTENLLDMFKILTLGSYGCIFMFIVILVLLYFDDRKGALYISSVFMITNLIFTLITMMLGESVYGFGFFLSTMLSLCLGLMRLLSYLKEINYHTFCTQPIYQKKRIGYFTRLVKFLEGILVYDLGPKKEGRKDR